MLRKVALITGSARRIGAIIAETLHSQGYCVVIHYRSSTDDAKQLCDKFNAKRENSAIAVQADLDKFDHYQLLIDQAYQQWKRLDVLVNNASSFFPTPVSEATESQWGNLMNSNLKGPYFLSAAASKYLSEHQGNIINIIDIYSQTPLKNYSIYSIAKAGLLMLTKSLAKELAPAVRVNGVAPGSTLWPENVNALDDEKMAELIERTALKRKANPQHIANAVMFYCENDSITGQVINVDAGRLL